MADPLIDIDAVPGPVFALTDELTAGAGHWHSHRYHQLLYAARGVMELEVDGERWTLPSARAAWLRAGVSHRVGVSSSAALRTVYFAPEVVPTTVAALGDCRVFNVSTLCREMILYGMRWGPDREPGDARANRFFAALADCCGDWVASIQPFRLPRARSPELATAMAHARRSLVAVSAEDAAAAGAMSVRTMTRRFRDETGTTWRAWLRKARILRSMELLADGHTVTEAALAVGFDSPAAFSHAFGTLVGDPPSVFARSIRSDG